MNKLQMDEIRKLAMRAANKAYADVMKTASEYNQDINIYQSYDSIQKLSQVRKKTQPSLSELLGNSEFFAKMIDKDIRNIVQNNNDKLNSVKITGITMFDSDFESGAKSIEFGHSLNTGYEAMDNSARIYVDGCKLTTLNKIRAYLNNEIKNGEYVLMYYKNIKPN